MDAEGSTGNDLQDGSQDLLSGFVEYIKVISALHLVNYLFKLSVP